MAHQVAWSPRAIEDLEAIAQYIAAESSAYAATVVKTILNTTRSPAFDSRSSITVTMA